MKLRVDIRPYFPKIATYYWEELPLEDGRVRMSIWDWLEQDYQIVKVGPVGSKPQLWVHFPDEKMLAWFLLRWG